MFVCLFVFFFFLVRCVSVDEGYFWWPLIRLSFDIRVQGRCDNAPIDNVRGGNLNDVRSLKTSSSMIEPPTTNPITK